jgi:retron-type reverse transcriptase
VYIPKADGRLWPLGIATLEDKIVQRAVVGVLNAVYGGRWETIRYALDSNARTFRLCLIWLVAIAARLRPPWSRN